MRSPDRAEPKWRSSRWWLGFVFLVLLQVTLLNRYGSSPTARPGPSSTSPSADRARINIKLDMDMDTKISRERLASIESAGPALFSLTHPRGFSGPVWAFKSRVEPPMIEWTENALWLPLDERRLGNTFPSSLRNQPAPDYRFKTPRTPARFEQLLIHTPLIRTNSRLRVAGPLAQRDILFLPAVPSLQHTNQVGATVIQIAVDADGFPSVLRPKRRSGWPVADEKALALAQSARFERIDDVTNETDLVWGELTFQWHVQHPSLSVDAP